MTRSLIILTSIFLLIGGNVFAQSEIRNPGDNGTSKKSFEDRFFIAATTSTYLDIATSPVSIINTVVGYDPDPNTGNPIPRYSEVPYQSTSWSIFSFGFEPRYNLMEMDKNTALAVSAPMSFGFGQTVPANADVRGAEGIGAFQLPVLLKLYVGNQATYDTEKDFGISIGGGLEYNRIGLISMGTPDQNAPNKGWVHPVATLGFHFWRGLSPMELNLKYGAGGFVQYDTDLNGNPITNDGGILTTRQGRSSSFKLSFVYLLNY